MWRTQAASQAGTVTMADTRAALAIKKKSMFSFWVLLQREGTFFLNFFSCTFVGIALIFVWMVFFKRECGYFVR
jgi:hypothetical protein